MRNPSTRTATRKQEKGGFYFDWEQKSKSNCGVKARGERERVSIKAALLY
jgi:hypothetical protein